MFLGRGFLELKTKQYAILNATMLIILLIISTVYVATIVATWSANQVYSYDYFYHGLDAASINLAPNIGQSEIVVTAEKAVRLFTHRQDSWAVTELLGPTENDVYTSLAVGEIYSTEPGEEIVVISKRGKVIVLKNSNGNWSSTIIYDHWVGDSLTVAIGDLDQEHSGNEIVVAGMGWYSGEHPLEGGLVTILSHEEDDRWNATEIEVANIVCSLAIGDFDGLHYGNECIIREALGKTEIVFLESNKWYVQEIWNSGDYYPYSIASGDVYPLNLGDEALITSESKVFLLYRGEQVNWTLTPICEDPNGNRLTSITIGEVGTSHNSAQIVTGSISGGLYELYFNGSTWKREALVNLKPYINIYEILVRMIISDVDSGHQGNEIVMVSNSFEGVISVAYKRNLFDRIFVSLLWIVLGFVLICVLNLPFLVIDHRQRRLKKLKESGYIKCPICGRYFKSDEIGEHTALHLPDGKD